ncbi:MAG: hypothetical protein ACFCU3_03645, partial [Verrucomicrobiales bacterium]
MPTIFLSAASIDLKRMRNLLHHAFSRAGLKVLTQDHSLGVTGRDLRALLVESIDQADCVVHLAGLGFGRTATDPFPDHPDFVCSWTQFEYYYAHLAYKETNKGVFGFACGCLSSSRQEERDDIIKDPNTKTALQEAHLERVAKGVFEDTPFAHLKRTLNETAVDQENFLVQTAAIVGALHRRDEKLFEEVHKIVTQWQEEVQNLKDLIERPYQPPTQYMPSAPENAGVLARGLTIDTLNFRKQWLPFMARDQELSRLREWMEDEAPFSWWAVTGEGGVGKSRLALELVREYRDLFWFADFLGSGQAWIDNPQNLSGWKPAAPALLVLDYASALGESLTRALSFFYNRAANASQNKEPSAKIRILLLERPGALPAIFSGNLKNEYQGPIKAGIHRPKSDSGQAADDPIQSLSLFNEADFLRLDGFADPDLEKIFKLAFERRGADTGTLTNLLTPEMRKTLMRLTGGIPLYLQIVADAYAETPAGRFGEWSREKLLDRMLYHEIRAQAKQAGEAQARWSQLSGLNFEDPEHARLRAFIGLLTLVRGADFSVQTHIDFFARLLGKDNATLDGEKIKELAGSARAILNISEAVAALPPLQPDLLAGRYLLLGGVPPAIVPDPLVPRPLGFDALTWLDDAICFSNDSLQTVALLLSDFPSSDYWTLWFGGLLEALAKKADTIKPEAVDHALIDESMQVSVLPDALLSRFRFLASSDRKLDEEFKRVLSSWLGRSHSAEQSPSLLSLLIACEGLRADSSLLLWAAREIDPHLFQAFERYQHEQASLLLLAQGAVNAILHYGTGGEMEKMGEWLGELKELARQHPDHSEIQLELAKGAFNAINHYGTGGEMEKMGEWLGELKE